MYVLATNLLIWLQIYLNDMFMHTQFFWLHVTYI